MQLTPRARHVAAPMRRHTRLPSGPASHGPAPTSRGDCHDIAPFDRCTFPLDRVRGHRRRIRPRPGRRDLQFALHGQAASRARRTTSTSGRSASKGMGDGSDKLVTIDVNPKSKQYGKVIHKIVSVGPAARRITWASPTTGATCGPGGLDDSKIFVFDMHADPAKPKLTKTITDLVAKTGFVGPHTFYALPGRMLVQACRTPRTTAGATGAGDVQQQGRHHRDVPDAHDRRSAAAAGRRLRLRHRASTRQERDADLQLHRLEQLHDGPRQAASRTARR